MKNKKDKYIYLEDGSVLKRETIDFCGEKIGYYVLIRNSDESIAKCNNHIEPSVKENHKVLRLSNQESDRDIIRD